VAVHATGARSCLGLPLAVPVGTPSLAVVAAVVVAIIVLSSRAGTVSKPVLHGYLNLF